MLLRNYIDGKWKRSRSSSCLQVLNPADQSVLAEVPEGAGVDVEDAVQAAATAFPIWREIPVGERVQYLFRLKERLEENIDDLSRTITLECGKVLNESRGELRRAIENVETACGMPMLMQGEFSENIAPGIDEYLIRQPVGVCACITPFNFPGMIPFWFLPYAIACGNTFIVKPSERVPVTMTRIFRLIEEIGLPPGVVNLVLGGKESVEAILEDPRVRAVSFVGSSPVASHVYGKAACAGKRVQAQGGARNPTIILPDADVETTTRIVADSVFGCAGQRCLATSVVMTVGEHQKITESLIEAARSRKTGNGLVEGVEMGPVISPQSKERIAGLIGEGVREGARAVVDGRNVSLPGLETGNFLLPTVLEDVPVGGTLSATEIFGPVMSLVHLADVQQAIDLVNSGRFGNMACLFTRSGSSARRFRHEVEAGNIGINVGVAAPMAQFPFSGWKESFFGDLHGQGRHAVEFFTQTKVVVERWLQDWSRKF